MRCRSSRCRGGLLRGAVCARALVPSGGCAARGPSCLSWGTTYHYWTERTMTKWAPLVPRKAASVPPGALALRFLPLAQPAPSALALTPSLPRPTVALPPPVPLRPEEHVKGGHKVVCGVKRMRREKAQMRMGNAPGLGMDTHHREVDGGL